MVSLFDKLFDKVFSVFEMASALVRDSIPMSAFSVLEIAFVSQYNQFSRYHSYLSISVAGIKPACLSGLHKRPYVSSSVVEITYISKYFSGRSNTRISVFSVVEITPVSQYFQWLR